MWMLSTTVVAGSFQQACSQKMWPMYNEKPLCPGFHRCGNALPTLVDLPSYTSSCIASELE
uniref:Uncharacterized protein n=1 Tax=Aegilops tauschii TaxID=37682 RepID=M8BRF4_AEGTA